MNEASTSSFKKALPATLYEPQILLAFMPPSREQRWIAIATIAALLLAFILTVTIGKTASFAITPMPFDAFVPILVAILFLHDSITATLLFAQFSITRSRALLVIASGYVFTALIVIPFGLSMHLKHCIVSPLSFGLIFSITRVVMA